MSEASGEAANTIRCSFSLSGRDFDPDACIREIGVEGAEVWRQRRPQLAQRADLPNVEVSFEVGPEPFESVDDAVRVVLARVAPATPQILACVAKHGLKASMTAMIKVYTERPLYELSPESMRVMAELGATFSIDLIDLRPNE